MKHRWALLWSWFVAFCFDWLPDAPPIMRWRGWLYGWCMRGRGRDFQVASRVHLKGLEHISVGDHVYLAPGVAVLAGDEVVIEDEVMIAYHSVVTDGNHTRLEGSYRFGPRCNAPVRIGRGTWIAANCTVVSGAIVGQGVLVAANSVVTGQMPDHSLVAGVPGRVIRRLDAEGDRSGAMKQAA